MVVDGVVIIVPEDDGDREEGEIVDEFEMIMSSEDEEFKLRARIQQLEENNKDVERMEMMLSTNLATSTQYNYEKPFGRYNSQHIAPVQVLSDVSSQSDSEYESQRKYCKHKIKRMDSKRHEGPARSVSSVSRTVVGGGSVNYRRHWPYVPRRSKLKPHVKQQRRPKQTYNHHKSNYYPHHQDNISVDSMDEDDEVYQYDCNDGDEDGDDDTLARINRLKLSRKKLRVALAREGTNELMCGQYKHSLKERLLGRRREKSPSPIPLSSRHRNKEFKHESEMQLPELAQEADDDEGVARSTNSDNNNHEHPNEDPAELKLRLIALKSAILKKHLARKKRDAERAYSPTDMINRVHPTISNDCDIDDLMEISPAASPERVPSPVPPPPQIDFEQTVDTKPVDMDLVETDSDDQRRMDSWNPWPNNYNSIHAAGGSFRCFMPSIPVPNVSVPIVIDDNEDGDVEDELAYHHRHHKRKVRLQSYDDDEVAPPPPPFNIPHMQIVDMDDDNDNARDGLNVVEDSFTDIQSISMDNSQTRQSFQSTDDEAGELRAMLLSNLKPSKETQQPQPVPAPVPASVSATVPASLPSPEVVTNDHDSDDPEALRSLLLSSIASKKKTTVIYQHREVLSPNERLKNAVKRFQEVPLPALVPSVPVVPMPVPPHPSIVNVPPEATETTSEISQEVVPVISLDIPPEISPDPPSEVPSEIPLGTPSEIPPEIPLEIPSETPAAKIPQNIIKIVKPNKVINKKTAIKRKMVTEEAVTRPSTLLVKETSAPLLGHNSSGGSSMATTARLITTVEPGSIKVKKLIISLGESSAGSDDELELSSCYASYATTYTDNASPLSLAMGSNSASTTRSNTPNSEILEQSQSNNSNPNLRRTVINEYFEKKLDDFLKQARSKVPTGVMPIAESAEKEQQQVLEKVVKLKAANGIASSATVSSAGTQTKPKTTPGAVRHLPVASQKEYLRLIERMRLLEKRKATIETNNSTATEKTTASTTSSPKGDPKANGIVAAATAAVEPSKSAVEPPSTSKAGLTTQQAKESRLKAFENSFNKIGGSMITNLEKSMQMVAEAKQSKITRLRCAHRLKELHAEMQAVKLSVKQEEAKLARIQPEIQASHEIIISLKLKRNKLYNAAMELGKGLRGDDYRLMDEDKPTIVKKSSTLSKEIRLYNSIVKYDDLDQLIQHENKAGQSEQMDNDNNEQTVEMANETEPLPSSSPIQSIETTQITTAAASRLDNQPQEEQKEDQKEEPEPESVPEPIVPPINEEMVDIQKPPVTTPRFMRELREDDEKDVDEKPFESKYLTEYRTPMSRNYNSQLDVNATICPFDLMGRCEDGDCPYLHLSQVEGTATPDP
ncbi:uncharacterized protein LOC6643430 [Drosophila willistoni]|uniref:uncharacterized protein LOC6643430 n=1 Tax=Drosophila willistoni TaxID=7260 RepID=UPI001F07E5B1|nr:uncharacterized protein LOC6643430 [Drosophila willistoni]